MTIETTPAFGVNPSSPDALDRLLRRAAMNYRLRDIRATVSLPAPSQECFAPIGETAGILWQVLSEDGPSPFATLMEEVSVPETVFFMAVGWLAREGKIEFERQGGDYTIRLK